MRNDSYCPEGKTDISTLLFPTGGRTPRGTRQEGGSYLEVTLEAAEELTFEEFERRKEVKPEEEVLRVAKKIINPIYKIRYNG